MSNIRRVVLVKTSLPYVAIFLFSLSFFAHATGVFDAGNTLRYMAVVLLFINSAIYFRAFNYYDLMLLFVSLIYYIGFGQSTGLNLATLILIAVFFKNESIDSFITVAIKILGFFMALWLIGLLTGVLVDENYTWYDGVRHSLGFININQSSIIYTPFLIFLYYKYGNKALPITLGLSAVLFYLTGTRTGFFILIFSVFLKSSKVSMRLYRKKNVINLIVLSTITTFTIAFIFSKYLISHFPWLDTLLSTRLSVITNAVAELKPINFIFGGHELLVDNSYIILVSSFGFIGYFFFLTAVYHFQFNADYISWSFIIMILLYGFFESIMFIPESIFAILFFVLLIKYSEDIFKNTTNRKNNENESN